MLCAVVMKVLWNQYICSQRVDSFWKLGIYVIVIALVSNQSGGHWSDPVWSKQFL